MNLTKQELSGEIFLLKKDLTKYKNDLIKWMFIFWSGQVVATLGFILLFFKK